ncbi:hypothetical protein BDV96DRAFT_84482 [Lophiotrema nucula]|uniref:Uncharacterized protein n=1 Tax=Lophiotrema nucula TaxID=690887 RepID=A0A6A5Z7K2_9PLEO|nr:hypothetical protein BDV96DRAFT_84482 [Lophiotrema nucula]
MPSRSVCWTQWCSRCIKHGMFIRTPWVSAHCGSPLFAPWPRFFADSNAALSSLWLSTLKAPGIFWRACNWSAGGADMRACILALRSGGGAWASPGISPPTPRTRHHQECTCWAS